MNKKFHCERRGDDGWPCDSQCDDCRRSEPSLKQAGEETPPKYIARMRETEDSLYKDLKSQYKKGQSPVLYIWSFVGKDITKEQYYEIVGQLVDGTRDKTPPGDIDQEQEGENLRTQLVEYESVLRDIASGNLNSSRPQLLAQTVVDKYVESKERKYLYFIDGQKYYTDSNAVTEEFLRSQLPLSRTKFNIYLEGPRDDPDRLLTDRDSIIVSWPLETRFYTVPSVMFNSPDIADRMQEGEVSEEIKAWIDNLVAHIGSEWGQFNAGVRTGAEAMYGHLQPTYK